MSYAFIRNKKYKFNTLNSIYRHNERKNTNYSNPDIDLSKTKYNYYFKKPNGSYIKTFNKIKEENNLKGGNYERNIIAGEFIISSDKLFFDKIGDKETKRYFQEGYNFIKSFNGLSEKYIISAVVHMDEYSPHMHVVYIPVVHKIDENTGEIYDKILSSEFWKGRFSYRSLQDKFYRYISKKGFNLERGIKHQGMESNKYKEYTNFDKLKKEIEKEDDLMVGGLKDVVNENKRLVVEINNLKLELKSFQSISNERDYFKDLSNFLELKKEDALMENYELRSYGKKIFEVLSLLSDIPKENLERVVNKYVRSTSTINIPNLQIENLPLEDNVIDINEYLEKNFDNNKGAKDNLEEIER